MSSQQFYNLWYNKFTTNGQKFAISQHLHMSRCWALALPCGKFVVELLWARPLVVSVGGVVQHVRSRCPYSGVWALANELSAKSSKCWSFNDRAALSMSRNHLSSLHLRKAETTAACNWDLLFHFCCHDSRQRCNVAQDHYHGGLRVSVGIWRVNSVISFKRCLTSTFLARHSKVYFF